MPRPDRTTTAVPGTAQPFMLSPVQSASGSFRFAVHAEEGLWLNGDRPLSTAAKRCLRVAKNAFKLIVGSCGGLIATQIAASYGNQSQGKLVDLSTEVCRNGRTVQLASHRHVQTSDTKAEVSRKVRAGTHAASARRFPPLAQDTMQILVRHALEDYAVDPNDGNQQLADAFVPLSDSHHYRVHLRGSFGSGQHEFCGFSDGFLFLFSETAYHTPQSRHISCPDSMQIYIATSGDGEYVPACGEPLSFEAPSTVFIVEPAGEPPAELTFAGHTKYIYIVIHRETLKTLYAGAEHELSGMLRTFLAGDLQQTTGQALPLSAAMLRCVDDVHSCLLDGRRRRLFLQSKAVEIICQALEASDQNEGFGSAETTKLTAKGVLRAQELLMEGYATPPSLEELAARVGLSRSALCSGFRQILGQSVFDYIQDLRMQHALELLNKRDDSITQIAYAVGYNRASSFSVAVHRYFGATPSELRRRGTLAAN